MGSPLRAPGAAESATAYGEEKEERGEEDDVLDRDAAVVLDPPDSLDVPMWSLNI